MSIQSVLFRTARGDRALEFTRDFFHEHGSAMLNAAAMLGGPAAHRRCLRLLADIAESASLSRPLRQELVWLHQLISLENVGEPDSEEAARFAMFDLLDPRIEEICLETDRLFELLLAISELDPECDVVLPEIFDLTAA